MFTMVDSKDLYVAAKELLSAEGDGCVFGISEVLEHLEVLYGPRFPMKEEADDVLLLIEALWRDPNVVRPPGKSIEFAWSEQGDERAPGSRHYPNTKGPEPAEAMRRVLAWHREGAPASPPEHEPK